MLYEMLFRRLELASLYLYKFPYNSSAYELPKVVVLSLACALNVRFPLVLLFAGWAFRIHPPVRVAGPEGISAATQKVADVFAADIAAHPEDWHMLQKLWVADLPARRRAALARASAGSRRPERDEAP